MTPDYGDLSNLSLAQLFALEVETQATVLTEGLLALESDPTATHWLESLMRAAHSLKGAAHIVERDTAVGLAHTMEDCFVDAQYGTLVLTSAHIDTLLQGVDWLSRISQVSEKEAPDWDAEHQGEINIFVKKLMELDSAASQAEARENAPAAPPIATEATEPPAALETPPAEPIKAEPEIKRVEPEPIPEVPQATPEPAPAITPPVEVKPTEAPPPPIKRAAPVAAESNGGSANGTGNNGAGTNGAAMASSNGGQSADSLNRSLRVSSDNLNRLMGLAGELMVTSRWAEGFNNEMLRLKKTQQELTKALGELNEALADNGSSETARARLAEVQQRQTHSSELLGQRLADLESFDRRFVNLSSRLYQEVLDCRMRPFSEGIQGFSRMVRDTARTLNKNARLEIIGENTAVDRDILERIEAPLGHLLRNAIDHGLESTERRRELGKTETAIIRLEAVHSAGMLLISVSDDGGGIDVESIRRAVVTKRLTSTDVAAEMSDAELLEFLFLPGFSMKEGITQISGRGVGLDAVQTMVREVGGIVRIFSHLGQGTQFQLQLPLTLSVIRTLLVEIGGEPYAFPLSRINSALKIEREDIQTVQGRQHFLHGGQQIGLVTAHQILEVDAPADASETISIIVLGTKAARYGLAVDRFLREQELVVRPLDPRLGKVKDISAAALMPDRSPVLIVDVEDLIRSIENLVSGGRLTQSRQSDVSTEQRQKRVLVVDDSLTVRELERKLLESRGYHVEVAVDGMDGWNSVRAGHYDLVLTDVDMPRMDGIELVRLIKQDNRLQSLPVMIVSYKDREEDRRRGLEAGADYYLTKGSFHDESLLNAVRDLVGEAQE